MTQSETWPGHWGYHPLLAKSATRSRSQGIDFLREELAEHQKQQLHRSKSHSLRQLDINQWWAAMRSTYELCSLSLQKLSADSKEEQRSGTKQEVLLLEDPKTG